MGGFGPHAQPQAAFERLADGVTHFRGQPRFGGVVVEREDGDRLDVGKGAAREAVQAAREPEARRTSDDCATEPARRPAPYPPRPQ